MSKTPKFMLSVGAAVLAIGGVSVALADPIPRPTASYSGKAEIVDSRGENTRVEVRASGPKLRYDLPASVAGSETPMAMVLDYSSGQMVIFPVGDQVSAGDRMAMQFSLSEGASDQGFDPVLAEVGNVVGQASYAGESCSVYEVTDVTDTGAIETERACVTTDGILLQSASATSDSFEMKSLTRGAQPDALFAVPAGYQIMDMNALAGPMGAGSNSPFGGLVEGMVDEAEGETERQARRETRDFVRGLFKN